MNEPEDDAPIEALLAIVAACVAVLRDCPIDQVKLTTGHPHEHERTAEDDEYERILLRAVRGIHEEIKGVPREFVQRLHDETVADIRARGMKLEAGGGRPN